MAKVRHPRLLLFMAIVFDQPTECPLIITELKAASLRNALYKPPTKLDNRAKLRIMNDVASSLHYLYTQREPILHRDVSSANVLLEVLSKTWRENFLILILQILHDSLFQLLLELRYILLQKFLEHQF